MSFHNPYQGDFLDHAEALQFIDECERRKVRILGVEWFRIDDNHVNFLDTTVWGDLEDEQPSASWRAARALLGEGIPNEGTHVEIVYGPAGLGKLAFLLGLPVRMLWAVNRQRNRLDELRGIYDSVSFALDLTAALRFIDECERSNARILGLNWRRDDGDQSYTIETESLRHFAKDPPEKSWLAAREFLHEGTPDDDERGSLIIWEVAPPVPTGIPDGAAYVEVEVQKEGLLRRLLRRGSVVPRVGSTDAHDSP